MAGGAAWSRRGAARARALRGLVRDTQRALQDVTDILNVDPDVSLTVHKIGNQASSPAVLVLMGGRNAQTRLLHAMLGQRLLDPLPAKHIWLKIQYGSSTQTHLTLGNSEFELVEELEANRRPWGTLPVEDLVRQDHMDLATILEIELNNQFLKDGLKIIIPPDIDTEPGYSYQQLKILNSDLYTKRDIILKTFNPIFVYAIDRIGKNIFAENFCDSKIRSKSVDDFWSTYNLYYMTRSEKESEIEIDSLGVNERDSEIVEATEETEREPSVFSSENCLDLHQMKEINPNAQVYFFLLADSTNVVRESSASFGIPNDATESTEDCRHDLTEADRNYAHMRPKQEQVQRTPKDERRLYEEQCAFMNELLDQWEIMSAPIPKHGVRSQWAILDDELIMQTAEQKAHGEKAQGSFREKHEGDRVIRSRTQLLNKVVKFASDSFQSYILEYCTKLSEVHVKLLQQFILASYSLARELQVVPTKIQYVATQEQQLYETIHEKFSRGDKKQELLQIMQDVLEEIKTEVDTMDWSVDDLPCHQDKRFLISNSVFYESSRIPESGVSIKLKNQNTSTREHTISEQTLSDREQIVTSREQKSSEKALSGREQDLSGREQALTGREQCSSVLTDEDSSDVEEAVSFDGYNFDDYEIINSNDESLLVSDCFQYREKMNFTDTSSGSWRVRVENERSDSYGEICTNRTIMSAKQASLDVQKTVLSRLSLLVSRRLLNFVDCLKDSYFGTLQRCLDSLEASCAAELGGRPASAAMRRLLTAARMVQLQPDASFGLFAALRDCVRRLLHRLRVGSGAADACCVMSPAWRRAAAAETARSLSAHRLAKIISTQILERLTEAHEKYQSALGALESALAGRLHHTEDVKLAIRKKYAPGFARLCLESTSICDLLKYGMPELGREIGRGQYGVVYFVRGAWANRTPVAAKSVLPADDRHYADLAMELFYTRSIPAHDRIVPVVGSLVTRHAAHGPTVLLISPRYSRDLHCAVRAGLPARTRMDIAIDIVEGIRYLHSLGLVHRDIKMKNVLLDGHDRAALADLGFCCAGALVSGSVVGTPVHMAPELLAGDYGADVDVYAFGILFWYLCAGSVKLPAAFEVFQNKEQLWNKVARGRRPERLPHFSDACWDIMSSCWAASPSARPLPGLLLKKLKVARQQIPESNEAEINEKKGLDGDADSINSRVEHDFDDI